MEAPLNNILCDFKSWYFIIYELQELDAGRNMFTRRNDSEIFSNLPGPCSESVPGSSGPAGVDCRAGVDCGGDASKHTEKVGREFSSVPVIIR